MSAYLLCDATAAQVLPVPSEAAPIGGNLPQRSLAVKAADQPGRPPRAGLQLIVTAASPGETCAAQAQVLCSNDGIHWSGYGDPLVGTSGASPVMATAAGVGDFLYYSAYIQSIAGAGARAKVWINT